jgi:hypothetical protein
MKTLANYQPETRPRTAAGWLPAQAAAPRALDLSHWLSRAARGHTWNGDATSRRRQH